jgi:hypothetical protein
LIAKLPIWKAGKPRGHNLTTTNRQSTIGNA